MRILTLAGLVVMSTDALYGQPRQLPHRPRYDDDDKAFLVELQKLAEQAEALTTN